MTTADSEAIAQQHELLATYRRTLAHLLQQAAQYGGVPFAPPQTANGIVEARAQIQQIKATLRAAGVIVEDKSNDDAEADLVQSSRATSEQRTVNTGGGPAIIGSQLQQSPIISNSTIQGHVISAETIYYQAPATPLDRQQQRNRRTMLEKVKSIWVKGLLEQSLAEVVRIDLGLEDKPGAVDIPLNLQYQELNREPRPIAAGTPIIDVFTQVGGASWIRYRTALCGGRWCRTPKCRHHAPL